MPFYHTSEPDESAICRGCGQPLVGKPYCYGGSAYHPITKKRAKVNYYGGYVCSRECDYRASLELEQSMPGHGDAQTSIGSYARTSLARNWDDDER